jgi:tetratricopeptide (TPR) repeat protein
MVALFQQPLPPCDPTQPQLSPCASVPQTLAACSSAEIERLRENGRLAMVARRYDAAAAEFEKALRACPLLRQPAVLADLSEALLRAGKFDAAISYAQRLVAEEPALPQARLALGNTYFMAGKLQDALSEAEGVLKSRPEDATALKLRANCEYFLEGLAKAEDTLLSLMARYPNDEDAAYMLGRMYYQDSRVEYAMGLFRRVLKINPRSHKAYDNLGLCYQAKGDVEMATRHFLTAIKLAADYDSPYANLASLLLDGGDAGKAFGAASKAADRNPYSWRNFFIGGKALSQLGKNDLAANWLERAVSLAPNEPDPLYLLARVYAQLGQEQKAKETLEKFREARARAPRQRK